jgi:hypothetical protein
VLTLPYQRSLNTNDNELFRKTRSHKVLYMGLWCRRAGRENLRVIVRDVNWFPLCNGVDRSWKYQCSYLNYIFVLDASVCYRYCVLSMSWFYLPCTIRYLRHIFLFLHVCNYIFLIQVFIWQFMLNEANIKLQLFSLFFGTKCYSLLWNNYSIILVELPQ